MKFQKVLQESAANAIRLLYNEVVNAADIQIQETRKEFEGDFTIVVFPFTRFTKKSPEETANILGDYLTKSIDEIESFSVVKGFLNFKLKENFWVGFLKELKDGIHHQKVLHPQNIMVEYSSPNTNKPLHLGHIRNNLLGYSVAEILKASGHKVTKANLINDRGIHICKSMLAWMKFGNGETPESSGIKGDHFVGKYYVIFDKEYKKEIDALLQNGIAEEEAKKNAPLMLEAQELLRKWEMHDAETIRIWQMMNGWVYSGFDISYKSLGVDFDKFYYESETYLLGKEIISEGLEREVFYRKDDGSVWVDLTDEGLDEKLLLRSDGTSVYMTQDLGTAQKRFDDYNLSQLVYVVGNEQEYHFKVLSKIFKKMGRSWWENLYHLSYGMVDLPSGKMKSREGTVVDADDLIADMIITAEEHTKTSGKTDGMSEEGKKELYRKVGMAALKFYLLKVDPVKRMLFNPEESIDFHGFTGPFVQYTYARIKSILRRNKESGNADFSFNEKNVVITSEEKELLKILYKYESILDAAAVQLSPALIANYIYDVAKTYNKFYQEIKVLNESNDELKNFRLQLCTSTAEVINKYALLLGIEMPEKM